MGGKNRETWLVECLDEKLESVSCNVDKQQ